MIQLGLQFIKFGLVGLSNTFISYVIYAFLTYCGVHYVLASVLGFIVSVINSFFWNNKFVFKKEADEQRNLWLSLFKTFLSYAGTGLVLSNILLIIFVERFMISEYVAPLISLIVTIPLNFIINKYWSFKTKKKG